MIKNNSIDKTLNSLVYNRLKLSKSKRFDKNIVSSFFYVRNSQLMFVLLLTKQYVTTVLNSHVYYSRQFKKNFLTRSPS